MDARINPWCLSKLRAPGVNPPQQRGRRARVLEQVAVQFASGCAARVFFVDFPIPSEYGPLFLPVQRKLRP